MKPRPVPIQFARWIDRWMHMPATLRRILLIVSLLGLPSRNFAQRAEPEPGGGASVVSLEDGSPSPTNPPSRRPNDPEGRSTSNLSDLVLKLEYPKLEVPENRAYIPLLFTLNLPDVDPDGGPAGSTSFSGTDDIVVRATFVGGSATPGKDFDISEPVRVVPAVGGFGSANWVELPLIQDEENEGTETAIFDLSIDGSTNAPVRMEVSIVDDLNIGEVGFVSPRFQVNEGSTNGYVELRMWRTLNSRNAATISYRLQGSADALAILGGLTNRTATFQPGESQIFIRIPLINNTEAQGTQDITFTIESSDDGMKAMNALESTVLTLADDETLPPPSALTIREHTNETGERGAQLSAQIPRGYQVRLEYSDNGVDGPWQLFWILEGADTERLAFDTFDASVMRMFRILPPEPLDRTFPW